MATRTIETKAVITAEDKSGAGFASFLRNLHKMESEAKQARMIARDADRASLREAAAVVRQSAAARRTVAAHDREAAHYRKEIEHHGVTRYAAQAASSALAAHSIVEGITESLKGGAELQHALTSLRNSGRSIEEIAEIMNRAGEVMKKVPTASMKDTLETALETTSAFGSVEHALDHLPFMMRTASLLKSASGGKISESTGEMGQQFAKFFEMRGVANDPKRFEMEGDEMVRAMMATGGTFNPREMRNFANRGKAALRNYDLDYLSKVVPSLVGENGGDTAGTAANAWFNVIMGKARDKKQAEMWMKAGLLDKSQVTMDPKGNVVSWSAGAVKNTDLAMRNPLRWFEEVELPALRDKLHINTDDSMELSKVHAQMYRNGMSQQWANENALPSDRQRLHQDKAIYAGAAAPKDAYARNLAEDPTVAITALKASFESLISVVSQPAMATAAKGMSTLASGIMALTDSLKDHPLLALAGGTAVAGGALAGSGYMAYSAANGFGLGSSAAALDGAAAALDAAAVKLGAGGVAGAAEGAVAKAIGGAAKAEGVVEGLGGLARPGMKSAGLLGMGMMGSSAAMLAGLGAVDAGLIYGVTRIGPTGKGARYGGGGAAQLHPADAAHAGMHFVPAPKRGSSGYWEKDAAPPTAPAPSFANGGKLGGHGSAAAPSIGGKMTPQKVDVAITPVPPAPVAVKVEASSSLLSIIDGVKSLAVKLQAKAGSDTGPGGMGETSTGQLAGP